MNKLIEKPAKNIKHQIEFWFLGNSEKQKPDFNGAEIYTFFDLITESIKKKVIPKLSLEKNEIPVLILKISESEFIVNSTHKFIFIDNHKTEYLKYSDFKKHNGFKEFFNNKTNTFNIKKSGHYSNFEIMKTNGEIVTRKIPTGNVGFNFWNTTQKCELIGRKYKIT